MALFGNIAMGFGELFGVLMLTVLAVVGVSFLDEDGDGEYSGRGWIALECLDLEVPSILGRESAEFAGDRQ